MHILLTDILGSCRPFAIETENASMARPTPSNTLLKKNKKFQKDQLIAEGYEDFMEFYKEELKR